MTPLRGANLKESTAKNLKIKDFPDFTTPCFSKAHVMGTLELGQEKTGEGRIGKERTIFTECLPLYFLCKKLFGTERKG